MDANQLLELVQRFHEQKDFIGNEETAKVALVIPFIRLLGYDPGIPREVRLEYAADFTVGDGKKLADRMDFAIFDKSGTKPLMVIETKPLGTDLLAKSQQLARYISQMPDLHFGIITDGCHYLFFGDLENPNQMDREPFFSFSLDDRKADWPKIAAFLGKFSRDAFNAETLVTDAENSRYRQAMIDRLVRALRNPGGDENFLRWLTEDIYRGKRTTNVMVRLGDVARDAIEPALLRLLSDDFLEQLKIRIARASAHSESVASQSNTVVEEPAPDRPDAGDATSERRSSSITTDEEMEFFEMVKRICTRAGVPDEELIYRDAVNYFNVSWGRPTRWFVRYFGNGRRRCVTSLVPVEEARELCPGFEVEEAPSAFGVSRIWLESLGQAWALAALILRSLELLKARREEPTSEGSPAA